MTWIGQTKMSATWHLRQQLGAAMRIVEFVDQTFHVENDLMLEASSYGVHDVMEPTDQSTPRLQLE